MVKYLTIVKIAYIIASVAGFAYGLFRGGTTVFGFDIGAGIFNGLIIALFFDGLASLILWLIIPLIVTDPALKHWNKPPSLYFAVIGAIGLVVSGAFIGTGTAKLTAGAGAGAGVSPEMIVFYMFFPSPPQVPTGWAYIKTFDPTAGINISTSNIRFYWWDNGTYYTNVSSFSTFLLNGSTVAFLNQTGYYPNYINGVEGGPEANPKENYLQMRIKPPDSNVTMRLIYIDTLGYGNWSATDIPSGNHTIRISFFVNSSYCYGTGSWIPPDTLPAGDMFAKNLSLNFIYQTGLWFGVNGSVNNLILKMIGTGTYNTLLTMTSINVMNVTAMSYYPLPDQGTIWEFSGDWQGIDKLYLSDLLIDNILTSTIMI